jgi:ABC-type branched-subunit amino acid transport system substrate-binding protein
MHHPSPSRLRLLAVLLALLGLVAAACGNSGDDEDEAASPSASEAPEGGETVAVDVPGVTDDEIRFAAFGTISNNPLGTCVMECMADGIEAYFAYRNSEGGVHGRDLVLDEVLDDQLAQNQQRAIEIASANDVFGAFSATQIANGWKNITEAGMPLYVWNIHPAESANPAVFGNQGVICVTCTKRVDAYAVKLKEAKKIAVVGYGISENSKKSAAATRDSIEKYSDEIGGAEVVYFNDNLAFGLPNGVGPEVTAMERAGVDMVFGSIDLNGMKTLSQEMERQGLGDVPVFHPNTYNQQFVEEAGDLFAGDLVFTTFRPFEAEAAGSDLELFKEWMDETGSELSEVAIYGWITASMAYEGLVAAGPDFDRQKVIDATNTELTAFTAGGLMPPIDFSRQHETYTEEDPASHGPDPYCGVYLEVQEDGTFEVVGDPEKPWHCWPAENAWSEPEQTNFE